jgi:hypothetical protein
MPDDMPFGMSDLIIMSPEGKEVEMAEGGVIHAATGVNVTPSNNPTMTNVQRVNNTGSTYAPYTTGASVVPLPTQPVPTKPVVNASGPPKFPEVMGDAAVTMRQYKNAAGYVMMIPHIGGKPMYPVPEGYSLVAEDGTTPDIPPATGETTPEETVTPEEPDYGGEVDSLGMAPGSVGSAKSLSDARNQFIDRTLKGTLTKADKLFTKMGLIKGLSAIDKLAFEKIRGVKNTTPYSRAVTRLRSEVINMEKDDPEYEAKNSLLDRVNADQDKKQGEINAKDPSIGGAGGDVTFEGVTSGVGTGGIGGGIGLAGEESFDTDSDDTDYGTASVNYGGIGDVSVGEAGRGGGDDRGGDAGGQQGGAGSGGVSADMSGPFNKGGLAGKKPKKKMKTYKKGGLATSKK